MPAGVVRERVHRTLEQHDRPLALAGALQMDSQRGKLALPLRQLLALERPHGAMLLPSDFRVEFRVPAL